MRSGQSLLGCHLVTSLGRLGKFLTRHKPSKSSDSNEIHSTQWSDRFNCQREVYLNTIDSLSLALRCLCKDGL